MRSGFAGAAIAAGLMLCGATAGGAKADQIGVSFTAGDLFHNAIVTFSANFQNSFDPYHVPNNSGSVHLDAQFDTGGTFSYSSSDVTGSYKVSCISDDSRCNGWYETADIFIVSNKIDYFDFYIYYVNPNQDPNFLNFYYNSDVLSFAYFEDQVAVSGTPFYLVPVSLPTSLPMFSAGLLVLGGYSLFRRQKPTTAL